MCPPFRERKCITGALYKFSNDACDTGCGTNPARPAAARGYRAQQRGGTSWIFFFFLTNNCFCLPISKLQLVSVQPCAIWGVGGLSGCGDGIAPNRWPLVQFYSHQRPKMQAFFLVCSSQQMLVLLQMRNQTCSFYFNVNCAISFRVVTSVGVCCLLNMHRKAELKGFGPESSYQIVV